MKQPFFQRRLILAGVSLLAATLACSAPAAGQETPTIPGVAEVVTNTAVVAPPVETEVVTVPPAEATSPAGPTAPPAAPSATTCLYNSAYVADLTIPDGTEIQVGNTFTKTWRIKNNGCQSWPAGTTLIFVSGNQMSGPANVAVPETAPNGTQDVSVNLKAPSPAGDFQGYWQLRTTTGIQFGDKVYVKIKSISATPPTATETTSVDISFDAAYVGGMWWCNGSPNLYNYTVKIKNTSTLTFESINWVLSSPVGTQINNGSNNSGFATTPTATNCNDSALFAGTLAPGASAWINAFKPTSALPSGVASRVRLKICTQDDLGGSCKTVNVNFTS